MKKVTNPNKGKLREPGHIAKIKAPIPKRDAPKPIGSIKHTVPNSKAGKAGGRKGGY